MTNSLSAAAVPFVPGFALLLFPLIPVVLVTPLSTGGASAPKTAKGDIIPPATTIHATRFNIASCLSNTALKNQPAAAAMRQPCRHTQGG